MVLEPVEHGGFKLIPADSPLVIAGALVASIGTACPVGIQIDDRERAKRIFVTLKPRDKVEGSGMGLAIADRICANAGGALTIADNPAGPGCKVTAYLPD